MTHKLLNIVQPGLQVLRGMMHGLQTLQAGVQILDPSLRDPPVEQLGATGEDRQRRSYVDNGQKDLLEIVLGSQRGSGVHVGFCLA
jgi:hypothetical protein